MWSGAAYRWTQDTLKGFYLKAGPGTPRGPPEELERGRSGPPCLGCSPHDPFPDERLIMDRWMSY